MSNARSSLISCSKTLALPITDADTTCRGVFSTTNAAGERVLDQAGWENAIQTVLAACKEFNVPCGFPATPNDIEMRMKQGFSVFVMNWGDAGFKAVELGRAASGR